MCGIAIHFRSSGAVTPLDLKLIHHRGPDSSGEWTSPDGRYWLGNTRLAIVDVSPTGAQPMSDPATGNVIVVNGEIYNHRAVREELGGEVTWRGTSDTETLLQAYARWRHGMLDRIKGMFAFAIYDQARQELFVARDRLGIKPLYYTIDEGGMRFASEVKVLVGAGSTITRKAVADYLQWGACPERNVLFDQIAVLPAGHGMVITNANERKVWRYWPAKKLFASSRTETPVRLRGLIDKAVQEHLLSDVPVASFLSGGIDSSIVTALAAQKLGRQLQTFSVGFDVRDFDETAIATEVARRYNTDHHRIELTQEEVLDSVTEGVEKLDLPSIDAINTYIVSKAVAARGVKVALTGLGGDELFGGYSTFRDVPRLKLISQLPVAVRKMLRVAGDIGARLADVPGNAGTMELASWRRRLFSHEQLRSAGLPNGSKPVDAPVELPDDYSRISWTELSGYMRRMLLRDSDQMSMAVSLELRVPFLDHELVEYILGLPAAEKKRYAGLKGLLVEACRDLLPASVYQRPKSGFELPMKTWMLGPLAKFVSEGAAEAASRGLIAEDFVRDVKIGFNSGRLHWTRMWSIVVLGHFAKRMQLSCSSDEDTPVHSFA